MTIADERSFKVRVAEKLPSVKHSESCPAFSVIHIGSQDEQWMAQIPGYCPYCGEKLDEDKIHEDLKNENR